MTPSDIGHWLIAGGCALGGLVCLGCALVTRRALWTAALSVPRPWGGGR